MCLFLDLLCNQQLATWHQFFVSLITLTLFFFYFAVILCVCAFFLDMDSGSNYLHARNIVRYLPENEKINIIINTHCKYTVLSFFCCCKFSMLFCTRKILFTQIHTFRFHSTFWKIMYSTQQMMWCETQNVIDCRSNYASKPTHDSWSEAVKIVIKLQWKAYLIYSGEYWLMQRTMKLLERYEWL